MSTPPIPVIFEPIFKPKPWGGRRLAALFEKPLPPGEAIGESWELVHLPGNQSLVRNGPLAGQALGKLVDRWGTGLLGQAEAAEGRFPLLIKFLDAQQHLSVQVHPKPRDDDPNRRQPGIKHEAWYVLHADPGAALFIGQNPGVTPDDLAHAANTPQLADLLRRRPVQPGQCFYLPSGIIHALGAGIVVAEIQTPSDVTYRLYDWDRTDADGKPRQLHLPQALQNVRWDIPEQLVTPAPVQMTCEFATGTTMVSCERFQIDYLRLDGELERGISHREMSTWIVLAGCGVLVRGRFRCEFAPGDVVLIPAENSGTRVETRGPCELLQVTVPNPDRVREVRPG